MSSQRARPALRSPAWLALAATGAFMLAVAKPASGSPLFELTGAVAGQGGLTARATESGAASAYFNPAFLPDATAGFEFGLFGVADQIGVHLDGRPSASADIPIDAVNMERPGGGRYGHYGVPTIWLEQGKPAEPPDQPLRARPRQGAGSGHNRRLYQVVGLAMKFWGDRLGVGVYAMIPYGRFTGAAAFYSDEREQYFSNSLHPELYADRLTATALSFGLGARLSRQLSLGAAFTLSLRTTAATPTYLTDVGNFQNIVVDSKVDVSVALAPHFAAVYKPTTRTRLSGTVHTPQKLEIVTNFSFLLSNGLEQSAALRFTHAYLPWMFGLGIAHDVTAHDDGGLTLVAAGLFSRWSAYLDRHGDNPKDQFRWYDTFSGAAGARYRRGAGRTFVDVAYQPSPVPDQTGRTNYVDSGRVSTSGGFDYGFRVWGGSLRIGVQAQVHRLLLRRTIKVDVLDEVPDDAVVGGQPLVGREGLQTNNPGWPGFSSEGWILGGGAYLAIGF